MGDPRQIVAKQVDDHQIFGPLLRIVAQGRRVAAARRRPLHRASRHLALLQGEKGFGRKAEHPMLSRKDQGAMTGAGTRSECGIKRAGVADKGHVALEGEIGLIDVAGYNMLQYAGDCFANSFSVIEGRGGAAKGPDAIWKPAIASTAGRREKTEPEQRRLLRVGTARAAPAGFRGHGRPHMTESRRPRGRVADRAYRRAGRGRDTRRFRMDRSRAGPVRCRGHRRSGQRARPLSPSRASILFRSWEKCLGLQHFRSVQDRRRAVEFAHHGTDDGRLPICRGVA